MSYYHDFLRNKITKIRLNQTDYSNVIKKLKKDVYNNYINIDKICKKFGKDSCIRTPSHT